MSTSTSTPSASVQRIAPLVFVTGNKNKLAEVKAILADHVPDLQSISIDLPELQGASAAAITADKAKIASRHYPYPLLVEDTSLCFHALRDLPGPYIKWFLDKLGHEGLNNLLHAYTDKSAYAQCIFALITSPDAEPILFDGRCPGRIVPARGDNKFGWDPIFEPVGYDITFAEMDKATKNAISHRAKSLDMVKKYLAEHPEVLKM